MSDLIDKSPEKNAISACCQLADDEYQKIIFDWNKTDKQYDLEMPLCQYFERQVSQTPDKTAVYLEGESLTYYQLNEKANQLAYSIREKYKESVGVSLHADTLIALYFERNIEMIISILAVLKAGGAYVPISPEYPEERISYILNDTQSKIILTSDSLKRTLQKKVVEIQSKLIIINVDNNNDIQHAPTENLTPHCSANDLAYIIYTSGTTGKPKGVMIEQKSVINHFYGIRNGLGDIFKRVDFATNYCFDLSVTSYLFPLFDGGCVYIYPKNITELDSYLKHLEDNRIDFVKTTPSIASLIKLSSYKIGTVLVGGERLTSECINSLYKNTQVLFNEYGPTEATIGSTFTRVNSTTQTHIGKAFPNVKLYILSETNQPVPIGIDGELYIAGLGVARGYHNRPDLNQERFIQNPFASENDIKNGYTRLYKTGDIVRWLPDGNIQYVGRSDSQIKLRGFRVELGEVESVINNHFAVKQSVVVDYKQNDLHFLVAYIVMHDGFDSNSQDIAGYLSLKLPEYMVPSTFSYINRIPLTHNGKIDKRALPQPKLKSSSKYVAPTNTIEKSMCSIWENVFGVKKIGIDDSFFQLGGSSLLAIKLLSKIRTELDIELPISLLFEQKTIAKITPNLSGKIPLVIPKFRNATVKDISTTEKENTDTKFPLSYSQESLLFIERFEQGSSAYHIPMLVQLMVDADFTKLNEALNILIKRHSILRTTYHTDNEGNNFQQVNAQAVRFETQNFESTELMLSQYKKEVLRPFVLTQEASIRLRHYRVRSQEYVLFLWHHIAFDGWSMNIFLRELSQVYRALVQSKAVKLPTLDINYIDYAAWQRDYLQGAQLSKLVNYWQRQLTGFETLQLPIDHPRPAQFDYRGQDFYFELSLTLSEQLRELARTQETTLYTVLLSGFYITLATLSGQQDIVVGTPSDNRHHAQTQSLVGFFVNSLVLRADVDGAISITELLRQVHEVVLQAKIHEELPFEKLVKLCEVESDPSRHPIFQVMFLLQKFDDELGRDYGKEFDLPFQLSTSLLAGIAHSAKFDLSLILDDSKPMISGGINFAQSLFEVSSITNFAAIYQHVLQSIVKNPQQSIEALDKYPLSIREKTWAAYQELNDTLIDYSQPTTLIEKISQASLDSPKSIAVAYEYQSYTHQKLYEYSNQIAHLLRKLGAKRNHLIGVFVERRIEFIPAILGILKSGAAYVPIDPTYPSERIQSILFQCDFEIVITQNTLINHIEELADKPLRDLICIDEVDTSYQYKQQSMTNYLDNNAIVACSTLPCEIINKPNDVAYIIFTSGSTGQPKGVQVTQQNIYNMSLISDTFNLTPDDKVLQFAPLCFDVSVGEIFPILSIGGQVRILPSEKRYSPQMFVDTVAEHEITVISMTPSYFYQLVEIATQNKDKLRSVKNINLGGEAVLQSQVNQWKSVFGNQNSIINCYGPTETTVLSSYHIVDARTNRLREMIVMGKPIKNTQIYIVDDQLRLCPPNHSGEILIGGDGVTLGYLNDKEKTAQVFIDAKIEGLPTQRYYKTGDLGRLLSNGQLEFLGRKDNQVKIRGFRVELGEIENAINELPEIKQAVVIDRNHSGNQYLAAYLVLKSGCEIERSYLAKKLANKLPDYMLPSAYNIVDTIPLTHNGKVDKNALPEPELQNTDGYVAPTTALEISLCKIWQSVIGVERVGINDNFFRIGGNSILSIQLIAAIRNELELDIPLDTLFEYKTITNIIPKLTHDTLTVIPKLEVNQYPLSFAQERLLFIERFEQGSSAYHIPMLVKLKTDVNFVKLSDALNMIIERHPILQTIYKTDKHGNDFQQVSPQAVRFETQQFKNTTQMLAQYINEVSRPFNLMQEVSIRLRHYVVGSDEYVLLLWHHIAFDGWSMNIFLQELSQAYQALIQNKTVELPNIAINYADYAAWQRDYLKGEQLDKLINYWQQQLSGFETLQLPTDYPRPAQFDYLGKDFHFELSLVLSEKLRELAKAKETTLYTILLSGFYITLATLTGQQDIVVGTPSDNRHHAQTQSLVGFFVNSLALRANVDLQSSQTINSFIEQVNQIVKSAIIHQELPFEKVVDLLGVERDKSRHPVYQVMFGLQSFGELTEDEEELPFSTYKPSNSDSRYSPAKFDLGVFLNDARPKISGGINFAQSLFDVSSIERFATIYHHVLQNIVTNPQQSIEAMDRYPLSIREETWSAYQRLNDTAKDYTKPATLIEKINQANLRSSNAIAVAYEEQSYTHQRLYEYSNQIAHLLREYGAKRKQLIGVFLERRIEFIPAILGILKSGAAYVAIDPTYPDERIQSILVQCDFNIVITQSRLVNQVATLASKPFKTIVCVDQIDASYQNIKQSMTRCLDNNTIAVYSTSPCEIINQADDVAYIIFTSGSTGQPKGVQVTQQNIYNMSLLTEIFDLTSDDSMLQFAPLCFDVSVGEIFPILSVGGQVRILPAEKRYSPQMFIDTVAKYKMTAISMTPSYFYQLVEVACQNKEKLSTVKKVILGGEAVLQTQVNQWKSVFGDENTIINCYGPTETTVLSSCHSIDASTDGLREMVVMGKPIKNTQIYIVDEQLCLCPPNQSGEILIGGDGVTLGYLNDEEKTAQVFIDAKIEGAPTQRYYKTGDLGRLLSNGQLEFLGRKDNQVKIRGFRVELGEIENAINDLEEVKQSVVVDCKHNGNQYLAAYLVLKPDYEIERSNLTERLSNKLPDYMLPSTYSVVDTIPLTHNGKVDKSSLPKPEFQSGDEYVAPTTALETSLCQIWQNVIGVEQVGINDNFFRIGGNSILSIQLTAAIRNELELDIPLDTLFEQKTIAKIIPKLTYEKMVVIPKLKSKYYPLSFAQERLLFIERFEKGSSAYHIPLLLELKVDVCFAQLSEAIRMVIERHPVLKTIFQTDKKGNDYQQISTQEVRFETLRFDDKSQMLSHFKSEVSRPFDLSQEVSIRLRHYMVGSQEYVMLLWHHIAFDGWSMNIFLKELTLLYRSFREEGHAELPLLEINYADYAVWQRDYLQGEQLNKLVNFWQQQLSGFETLQLPLDHPRPQQFDYRGKDFYFELNLTLSEKLRELAKTEETTLYTVLLSGFYITLAALSGQRDIVVGTPSDNRHHAQTQSLIGFFINSLALRADIDLQLNAQELISSIHQVVTQARINQELPFEKMVEKLGVSRDMSRHPVFQVMFSLQSFIDNELIKDDIPYRVIDVDREEYYSPAKYDISLFLDDASKKIKGNLNFAKSLFNLDTIQRFVAIFKLVLLEISVNKQKTIANYELLTTTERQTILEDWNDTKMSFPSEKTLVDLFEEQVIATPNDLALTFENSSLSYEQLNEKVNLLTSEILNLGTLEGIQQDSSCPDSNTQYVMLYMERSLEMVVSILAVLKAGYAYVPVSPEFPAERINFIIDDVQASIVITQSCLLENMQEKLPSICEQAKLIEADKVDNSHKGSVHNHNIKIDVEAIAYVIYTSGTTGKPKGVMVPHIGAVNRIHWMQSRYPLRKNDRVLQKTAYTFDVSVWELLWANQVGATIVMAQPEIHKDPQKLVNAIESEQVTTLHFVPSMLSAFCYFLIQKKIKIPKCVSKIFCSGEALTLTHWEEFNQVAHDKVSLSNLYGPTEASIDVTYYDCDKTIRSSIPIGKAIDNTTLYVLNENMKPLPIGAIGELYIGGVGLARGYLNRPELTAEKFVVNPFVRDKSSLWQERLYRTGDLVRWLPDGNLEYLGRNDSQVKIRGFRIELGEVENVLINVQSIAQAIVVANEHEGRKFLAAYIILEKGCELNRDELRLTLASLIPDYMIPTTFTEIDTVPVNSNGKLDIKALPKPEFISTKKFIAAETLEEKILVEIWASVLSLDADQISVNASFFDLGGQSLLTGVLANKINQKFGCQLHVVDIFERQSIREIVQYLEISRTDSSEILKRELVGDVLLLKQGDVNETPLFLAHPVGGYAHCYAQLANLLHYPGAIYGLQSTSNKSSSLEEMATFYLDLIENIQQKNGQLESKDIEEVYPKIALGGWSMGGVVAYEIAQQLERRGGQVTSLLMIDSISPLLTFDSDEVNLEITSKDVLDAMVGELGIDLSELENKNLQQMEAQSIESLLLNLLHIAQQQSLLPQDFTWEEMRLRYKIIQKNRQILSRYQATPYHGNIGLIRARLNNQIDEHLGWKPLCNEVKTTITEGNHFTLISRQYVEGLAQIVNQYLEGN
ncbi:amino acid adenylation domain-containing protein [Aliikangiella sp. IMCC44359]|uniref:amino acid adenylation domain-containing protein n=1 Tax=Aliikangiella sp. IMCC44359 TaxID=3459125 RepID=UPI00403ACD28